ncbi:leucyl aminopeptidase family protein [Chryseobacterium sp. MFBS3-17]|uniref:leucyl aminopeptidase family protein n=1 Tax=Chryseobacterium sp. MFBS3-17 TaxID=2886689 RepID=UPI001D0E1234|nr:leucyl aminopeptidase family protein [Chryseobacterium sp. MFBS3-17]MCC2589909.1 leucyl aminopeptidase family protein [Chryseobacterium sp. MFBS3-17]
MRIVPQQKQDAAQYFNFYTPAQWQEKQEQINPKIGKLFSGQKNETFILVEEHAVTFLIGLGDRPDFADIQNTAAQFAHQFRKKISAVPTGIHAGSLDEKEVEQLATGLSLGTYEYPYQGKHPFCQTEFELRLNLSEGAVVHIEKKTSAITEGQFACMEWLNKPQNHKRVSHISVYLKEISERYGFKLTVFDRQESAALGLGAFLAVNDGSSQDAAFTILEYRSAEPNAKTIGLVGKCVLFDTGGISIKSADNLHYMKSDMGGATAVIGTLIAAAEMKLPVNIVAVLPVTDNVVSNTSYLPSDVVTAYNGKTIEIINTDAEGRLTLADGLSYLAANYKTDVMIDLATLTGSSVRMFGNTCGALFSNDAALAGDLAAAGDHTGQRLWPLPLWDVWKEDFTSDVADFKNISLKPVGDCIIAAKFLEQFIENHPAWAHLDIAGVSFGNVPYAKEKAATGYGVQLLLKFIEKIL